jgi:hypothetical protein
MPGIPEYKCPAGPNTIGGVPGRALRGCPHEGDE